MDVKPPEERVGKPDCDRCHGSGFVLSMQRVVITGVEAYYADFESPCNCRSETSHTPKRQS